MRQQQLTILLCECLYNALNGRPVSVPAPGRLLWRWFLDLCRTRTSSGMSPNRLSYAEIEAYARLHRLELEPRHIDALMTLDQVWMTHALVGSSSTPGPSQPISPEAFDAVFS